MKTKIVAIFTMTVTMLFGALTSSQANGSYPYAEISFSNSRPSPGDAVVIYLDLFDCGTFPTNLSVNLGYVFESEPFATLTKSTSGYRMKKVGSVYKVQWIYRGPLQDGVTSNPVDAEAEGSGGCIADSIDFREESERSFWIPTGAIWFGLGVYNFRSTPDASGLNLSWEPNDLTPDASNFFEIQYAIAGTDNWSRSFVTKDWSYKLRGLSKGTVYDIRIRAGNKTITSDWFVSDMPTSMRTPASFAISSESISGTPTRFFSTGETVKIKMKLPECSAEPQRIGNESGYITYYLSASDGRTHDQFPTQGANVGDTGFNYDGARQVFEGEFEVVNLPNGTYTLDAYLFGGGSCGWTYSPITPDYPPFGNRLEFSVGPKSAQIPTWGNPGDLFFPGGVAAHTSTSANLAWAAPRNLEDGPFTFTVQMLKPDETVLKVLGTTKDYTFNVTGLKPATKYLFRIVASNAVSITPEMRPATTFEMRTANVTVKRGSKLTAAAYAKAVGVSIPSGATATIAKPAGTFPFTDCKFAKNVVTFNNSVGACTVQLTIKPKKVGKTQPKSIISQHDVMIKR